MLNPPKTRENAEKYRYGEWAGNPKGMAYWPNRCAYEICDYEIWTDGNYSQCSRNPGYGPDNLYCKQHARMVK